MTEKRLTDTEHQIAELIGSGKSVKQAAAEMQRRGKAMAPATVTTHVNKIAAKIPNPFRLTPMAAIRVWWGQRMAS